MYPFFAFRKLEKQKEKLCNTAKGRELPECLQSSSTLPPSIVPLVTTTSDIDYISDITSIPSQLGNQIKLFQNMSAFNRKHFVRITYLVHKTSYTASFSFIDVPSFCKDQGGALNATISAACANLTSKFATTEVVPFDSSNGTIIIFFVIDIVFHIYYY